ncbi:MAG TPA: hypothetical protein VGM92_01225 [Candidatus Kapabacteria bacterium]|jgi:hypothetical protein
MPNIIPSNSAAIVYQPGMPPDAIQLLRKAEEMMRHSVAFGFKRFMFFGAALHNIKSFDLHKLNPETQKWGLFLDSIGIDSGSASRYLSIGASISERLKAEGKIKDGEPVLMGDVRSLADENLEKLKDFTMREIAGLSSRVDIFDSAMNGQELQKLLPGKKEPTDQEQASTMKAKSALAEFNDHMRKTLEPYGWRWNAKDQRCEHEDGTPLTDEEYGQITTPDMAAKPFRMTETGINRAMQSAEDELVQSMKLYTRYNLAVKNTALQNEVYRIRQSLHRRFECMTAMLDAVIEGDEAKVKDILKRGLGE